MQDIHTNQCRDRPHDRRLYYLVVTLVFTCTGIPSIGLTDSPTPPTLDHGLAVIQTPNGSTIYAEIADTPEKRTRGLMYRTNMAPDRGMLFTFSEPGLLTFWMKNTKMALDMLWLDQKGTIVHIEREVPICERTDNLCPRYRSTTSANFVLELKNGQAEKLGLKKGNRLTILFPH